MGALRGDTPASVRPVLRLGGRSITSDTIRAAWWAVESAERGSPSSDSRKLEHEVPRIPDQPPEAEARPNLRDVTHISSCVRATTTVDEVIGRVLGATASQPFRVLSIHPERQLTLTRSSQNPVRGRLVSTQPT